tara:strand:- start:50 stop:796 length:747 start_codon:yes stop_codon:yes gene_type:complete
MNNLLIIIIILILLVGIYYFNKTQYKLLVGSQEHYANFVGLHTDNVQKLKKKHNNKTSDRLHTSSLDPYTVLDNSEKNEGNSNLDYIRHTKDTTLNLNTSITDQFKLLKHASIEDLQKDIKRLKNKQLKSSDEFNEYGMLKDTIEKSDEEVYKHIQSILQQNTNNYSYISKKNDIIGIMKDNNNVVKKKKHKQIKKINLPHKTKLTLLLLKHFQIIQRNMIYVMMILIMMNIVKLIIKNFYYKKSILL